MWGFMCCSTGQVSCHTSANWAAGALVLVSETLKAHPGLWAAIQQPEDAGAGEEEFKDLSDRWGEPGGGGSCGMRKHRSTLVSDVWG